MEPARVSTTSSLDQALLLSTAFGVCDSMALAQLLGLCSGQVRARRTWEMLWQCARRKPAERTSCFIAVMTFGTGAALLRLEKHGGILH